MSFIDNIKERAKAVYKTIVLPEGMERRTWEAAEKVIKEKIAKVIILATPTMIYENAEGIDISGMEIIDPNTSGKLQEYVEAFTELRKSKGMTEENARRILTTDFMYFACMMVKLGDADGVVSGACHSSANTLRPSLQILKTKPGAALVSAFFLMIVPNCIYGDNGTFIFSDCGLEQNPTPEKLAAIAVSSAETFRLLVQKTPYVAMLSHSTKGSAKHDDVTKVVDAVRIAHKLDPDLLLDGEMQTDAALVPEVAAYKAPGSKVAGRANVLIFPDLDAGNIGYKLVERLAKAEAYGPITQGLAGAVNDLSRGCNSDDIVGVVAITAVQAEDLANSKPAPADE
ncbi:MAG: phosphate acetyltransferase [Lachnospiraceae bacterium]|nr:phosphate acetyltransferase [Lachnospiraceae bacterium]